MSEFLFLPVIVAFIGWTLFQKLRKSQGWNEHWDDDDDDWPDGGVAA